MPPHHADGSAALQVVLKFVLAAAACLGVAGTSAAADRKISPQTAKFNCSSVKAGDTLTLESGQRGPLKITNCKGTKSNPIVVRNDPDGSGPVVIRRTSGNGGFIIDCTDCVGVDIDGSYKWRGAPGGKTYGIQLTVTGGGGPSAFLRISGTSQFVTIRNVEIDGAWPRIANNGSGIRINDNRATIKRYPGKWREDILIEDTYIHDVSREGMYVGPNYNNGELPLRNIEIRHNLLEDIGYDGINTKSMLAGDNSIHHNVVRRAGKNTAHAKKSSQYSGIKNISGTVKIYNNWVESTGQHGIVSWTQHGPRESERRGPFAAQVWNNVVVDSGSLWKSFMGKSFGIKVGAERGLEKPVPFVYNNTVVGSRHGAINIGSHTGAGFVRDNIAAGSGGNPVISAPKSMQLTNNRIGSVSDMGFDDPGRKRFRLKSSSPARNDGSNDYPPIDFDDVRRPKDGAPDQGAYEGSN